MTHVKMEAGSPVIELLMSIGVVAIATAVFFLTFAESYKANAKHQDQATMRRILLSINHIVDCKETFAKVPLCPNGTYVDLYDKTGNIVVPANQPYSMIAGVKTRAQCREHSMVLQYHTSSGFQDLVGETINFKCDWSSHANTHK